MSDSGNMMDRFLYYLESTTPEERLHAAGFPVAEPRPEPMMVSRPCGCTSMVIDDQPVQVSWCVAHDPGYTPPGSANPTATP